MLSDNIRAYRKMNNLSQDELAEKLGVSRQSVSFWENGQTQPTIDNIVALSKIFHVSTDVLLGNSESANPPQEKTLEKPKAKKRNTGLIVFIVVLSILFVCFVAWAVILATGQKQPGSTSTPAPSFNTSAPTSSADGLPFDLFTYLKNFAIEHGELNGDYCIYQQPATKYGGYENEYFSISYWTTYDKVEFSLHCPLSETQSHNFYLTMRGGFDGTYEYSSSKYWRDTGESFRYAMGHIDPAVFSDRYPLPCDVYEGNVDGQDEFMEQSRVGICDLIACLKQFVTVENMKCDFSVFGFVNF